MNTTDQAVSSQPTAPETPQPPPATDTVHPGGPRTGARVSRVLRTRGVVWVLGLVAAAWLVCVVTVVVGIAWLLPPALVLAVAAVIRTGRTVLDRLMASMLLLAGIVIVGGLVFSVWPWGIAPIPVAGSILTVVIVAAAVAGRRPSLPRRFMPSDAVVLGAGLFTFAAAIRPVLRIAADERFRLDATAEDRAAHFAIFDTVHRLGSYPFFDQVAARISIRTPAETTYPAGSHLLYAVFDTFLRATSDPGSAIAAFHRYFILVVAGYAFLIATMVWGARWILTPVVGGWRLIAATSVVAAIGVSGPLMYMVTAGFDSQVLGLAFLLLTVAFAVRPPAVFGERILLLGSGVIVVSFVYDFYLVPVAVAVLASIIGYRRATLPRWRLVLIAAVPVAVIAAIPLVYFVVSSLAVTKQAAANGITLPIPHAALFAATIGALAPLATALGRQLQRVKVAALLVSGLFAVTLAFGAYQMIRIGHTSYYFNKLIVCLYVVAIVCAAPMAIFLSASPGTRSRAPRRSGRGGLAVAGIAVVFALTAVAGLGAIPKVSPTLTGQWGDTSLGRWYSTTHRDELSDAANAKLFELDDRGLLGDGVSSLYLVDNDGYINWRVTFYAGVFNRDNGVIKEPEDRLLKIRTPFDPAQRAATVDSVLDAVSLSRRPLRIVVSDPATAAAIESSLAERPELRATVVTLTK